MEFASAEPNVREMETALAELCAGRHVTLQDVCDDPDVRQLVGSWVPDISPADREGLLESLLRGRLERRHLVVRTLDPLDPHTPLVIHYTLRADGETYSELWGRHAQDLIVNHPAAYFPEGFLRHMTEGPGDRADGLRRRQAATFALRDGRLAATWYEDGLPDLQRPLRGPALDHLVGYAAALRARTDDYVTCIAQGPHRLRRELAAARLPCLPDPPAVTNALPRTAKTASLPSIPLLWMALAGEQAADDARRPDRLYLFYLRQDPVVPRRRMGGRGATTLRVVGTTSLRLTDLAKAELLHRPELPHRCCPEVNGWVIAPAAADCSRFHLAGGPLPPIPTARHPRGENLLHGPLSANPPVPLQPLGWLATATLKSPWEGLLLWGDGHGRCVWEEARQNRVEQAVREGRTWHPARGGLATTAGRPLPEASAIEVQTVLTAVLPYCLKDSLGLL
jgi:hypothetical protein